MESVVLFVTSLIIVNTVEAKQGCMKFGILAHGKRFSKSTYVSMTTTGIMACAKNCILRRRCLSLNYFQFSDDGKKGHCELNAVEVNLSSEDVLKTRGFVHTRIRDWPHKMAGACSEHSCPLHSYCDDRNPVSVRGHTCVAVCDIMPNNDNGLLVVGTKGTHPEGTVLDHTCRNGYVPNGVVECRSDGTWNTDVCVSATSCGIIKLHKPDSEDGEYWLRLPAFDNYKTRIYCYNMSTDSPQEFLTLTIANYGIYPRKANHQCKGETNLPPTQGGEIWFQKVKVNVSTMQVDEKDSTFCDKVNNAHDITYGAAVDCYTAHFKNNTSCGVKGVFLIDLRGTGWKVREDQQWRTFGWRPMIQTIVWEHNGSRIELTCGGHCGGCHPDGGLFLVPSRQRE